MTLKKLKENIISIILSLTLCFAWAYIIDLGKEQKQVRIEIELIKVKNLNQDEKMIIQDERITKQEKSRESLSNYYVTRPEFNRIIEDQKKLLEKIDQRLEKLTDKFYSK